MAASSPPSESQSLPRPLAYASVAAHAYGRDGDYAASSSYSPPPRDAFRHGLHTHFEEGTDDSDADADDDCDIRTNSTVSLNHYRPTGSDRSPDATSPEIPSNDFWDDVDAKAAAAPTPPKSPESLNWPLPVSPKTIPRQFSVSPESNRASSPRRDDRSERSVDVWSDVSRTSSQRTSLAPISLGAPGWPLPNPDTSSSSPRSASAASLPTPRFSVFPIRTQSLLTVGTSRPVERPLDRPFTNRTGRSWQEPWSQSPSSYDYEDPHPGTRVDPSQVDDHDGCDHTRPVTSASSLSKSFNDFAPSRRIPMLAGYTPTSVLDYFPKNGNAFAGFCKCAWRLQTTQTEKAFVIRSILPKTATSAAERRNSKITTLKCKKCSFEGPLIDGPATNASPSIAPLVEYAFRADRTAKSAHGVTYNWNFLFKSHIPVRTVVKKEDLLDPLSQTFACLFCCAIGAGTVCFDGAPTLCGHIARHHPEGVPDGPGRRELSLRVVVLIGEAPKQGQDWDIILPGHYQTYATHEKERAFSH